MGRALSAYKLVVLLGVFVAQWGTGAAIDALRGQGWPPLSASRAAFALWGAGCVAAALWFLRRTRPRRATP